MKERRLYINVDETESRGYRHSDGDGSPYSGFSHSVIEVSHWGPLYFAEEGKGWGSSRFDKGHYHYDFDCPQIAESDIPEDAHYLYVLVVRYGDGGTFGRTDGYYNFPGVFLSADEAYAFGRKHEKELEKGHSGYFETYEGWSVEMVELKDETDVEKRW